MRNAATTPNGVLGSKMMWNDFDRLRSSFRPVSGTDTGAATDQWALRPDQEPEQPAPDVERIAQLVRFAEGCEDGWRRWFASTGIQPCEVVYG